eukprot:GHRQ01034552.1.p1 GENE.GHRQ01034552.1~~GHRQ01034552.1.p1  ORF type:complete len:155 (-),score=52.30 GHRQ01034552.1:3-467(-)
MESLRQHASANTGSTAAAPAAWALYFGDCAYVAQDRRALLVQELLVALKTDAGYELLAAGLQPVQQEYVLELDYQRLTQLCDSADLAAALEMQPLEGIACLQAAAHEVRMHEFGTAWQRSGMACAASERPAALQQVSRQQHVRCAVKRVRRGWS